MLEQQGQVVAVAGDLVSVRLGGSVGCSACDAGKGCGAGIFAQLFRRKPATFDLVNELDVHVGQAVIVGIPESLFLRLLFRLYLFPLLLGLAGMVFGHYISVKSGAQSSFSDGAALIAGLAASAIAILWNRKAEMEFHGKTDVHLLHVLGGTSKGRCDDSGFLKKN